MKNRTQHQQPKEPKTHKLTTDEMAVKLQEEKEHQMDVANKLNKAK